MADDPQERIEKISEGTGTAPDNMITEASAGKVELVEEQKRFDGYLKSGGRSGISDDFGKPLLVDGRQQVEGGESKREAPQVVLDRDEPVIGKKVEEMSDGRKTI